MAEQSGMDILCDAAGSDLLLTSSFVPLAKRVRLSDDESPPPSTASATSATSPHVCHICKRVYERADHLTRHLRSHENARPYQCSRCPKRFNRADLLTRHETTHDRDGSGKGRAFIRRSDRAAEACLNCAASKSKCDDQKPCGRCRSKSLICQMPPKRPQPFRLSTELSTHAMLSPTDPSSMMTPVASDTNDPNNDPAIHHGASASAGVPMQSIEPLDNAAYLNEVLGSQASVMGGIPDDMVYFDPTHTFFQDMEFAQWDLNFDGFTIPHLEVNGPSPQSTATNNSKPSSRALVCDPFRGHAAFKRSPWIWEPQGKDYVRQAKEGLHLSEETVAHVPAFDKSTPMQRLKMSARMRDRLFAMVLEQNKDPSRIPPFPSLEILNYLLQAHFVQDQHQCDSWIHPSSVKEDDADQTLPILLTAIIANGATLISVPDIWKFGLALQEVVRLGVEWHFERDNSNTRDLNCLQAYSLNLDVGFWSGFKRKMELAESFSQPLITMLRRAGVFSAPADSPSLVPLSSDSPEILQTKWEKFLKREAYKRLVIHVFFHDIQSSVSLQKNPLMSYNELCFSLPASRDLWRAPTAIAWRDAFLRKKHMPPERQIPRVADVMQHVKVLDEYQEWVDVELCYSALLYGHWGQITAYREAVKFYQDVATTKRNTSHHLWLKSQHQELYRDLTEFSTVIYISQKEAPTLAIIAELFMMILHVSPDDLQKFAGKFGEEEARRASISLETGWVRNAEARYAVWHAGQVFYNARRLPPTSLRSFNAVALYLATLTMWVYGLLSCPQSSQAQPEGGADGSRAAATAEPVSVLLDGEENRDTRAFLQLDRGNPGIARNSDIKAGAEPLSNPDAILAVARQVFRNNFPVTNEPLPPLVESMGNLLRDLGSGPVGRASRAPSESSA